MSEETFDLNKVMEGIEEIGRSLDRLNTIPETSLKNTSAGVEDQGTTQIQRTVLTPADRFALKQVLKSKTTPELYAMLSIQAAKQESGVPVDAWANAGGYSAQNAMMASPMVRKALDSSGVSALIRQDLEPVLYELFVREFPAWDAFAKEPANGLVHAYDQATSFGGAAFLSELGTVSDDQGAWQRQTTNVAILATRRGVSLKGQYATVQSGSGFSPEALEMQNGLRSIAHEMQKAIFQGNATASGGTANSEDGAYDANAFDGLRKLLNTVRAGDADPTGGSPDDLREYIDRACEESMNNGGTIQNIYLRPTEKITFDLQQDKNVRYMNTFVNVAPGVLTNAVNTIFGPLPLSVIPGDSIGTYSNGGTDVADIYLLDERSISLPWLGSEGPTVLDIPIGISGQLTHLFIIFGMWGLALKAPIFSNKVRITQ